MTSASLAAARGATGRSSGHRWAIAAVAAALALWPLLTQDKFFLHVGTRLCFAAIGAASLHLIIRTGHVSLGHTAFMGVGAYTSVYLVMQLKLPFLAGLVAATGASALLALAIGPVILRLTGKYFVLITFLLGEIARMVYVDWRSVTGGANGIFEIPPPAPVFAEKLWYYYLALAAAAAVVAFCGRLLNSEVGRAMESIREGERLAECSGVPVIRTKITVFVIACALVGFQGSLQAHYETLISPQLYSSLESLNYVIMNVIGGMHTLVGPLVGAAFMIIVPELLRDYVNAQHILFGIILIVVMAGLPTGLVGMGSKLIAALRGGSR
ncbi:MAG: branched-chain amino acid ABC transporter permease [Alphaproteobacteria bacterium]|nr:branched-chain amino acid ABC transporter permease [Alphaproteobacteria bacterium]